MGAFDEIAQGMGTVICDTASSSGPVTCVFTKQPCIKDLLCAVPDHMCYSLPVASGMLSWNRGQENLE